MDVLERIKEQVESNPIVIYMKGTPQLPQCGFSSRTAEALKSLNLEGYPDDGHYEWTVKMQQQKGERKALRNI